MGTRGEAASAAGSAPPCAGSSSSGVTTVAASASETPSRHPCVERRLKGRDQLLKLFEGQAGAIQERCGARLQIGEPYTSHESCLLSLSRDVRGASYQKESEINLMIWGARRSMSLVESSMR